MDLRLEGKVAAVTGAGSGIGRGIALGMAEAGAAVCAADVVLASAQATAEDIQARGGRGLGLQVNVTDRISVEAAIERVIREFGRLDILVNSAGVVSREPLLEVSEAEFDRMMAVNVKGPLFCVQAAVPRMRATGGGSIINIVSAGTELVPRHLASYVASKGALKVLTKAMAVELAEYGIRVNGIVPHLTATGLNRDRLARPGEMEREVARIPLRRVGRPEDYAGPAILLASDSSSWMTGSMVWVDGGFLSTDGRDLPTMRGADDGAG